MNEAFESRTVSLPTGAGRRRWWGQGLALLVALVAAACGGGGDSGSSTATASTPAAAERATAYAAGPISGFGSIIVNGVRYDDSGASVSRDDDGAATREQLKLGMMVEIEGAGVDALAATGRALRVRFGSEIVGPVSAVDTAAGALTVLGQKVVVTDATVFDDSLVGGLAGIDASDVLEVHALYNATDGSFTATRIEDAAAAVRYRLRGVVADLDTTAKTFTLGGQVINYGSLPANAITANLANGVPVRALLMPTPVNGQWVATVLRPAGNLTPSSGLGAHLRGAITVFGSSASFEINGLKVDAANASFPDGTAGIVLGAVVEVHGTVTNGVLVATKVELDNRHAGERHRPVLIGSLSALDTVAKTFKLRGVTVNYAKVSTWSNGTVADLADGKTVKVKGTPSGDRTQLVASEIEFR